MRIRFITTFFLAIAVIAPSSRALEFRLLSWAGSIEDLRYANGSAPIGIVAWDSALSPRYHFTGPGPLVFFREIEHEGKNVREPVATLRPPAGLTHAILLLAATDAERQNYTALWMDDSPEVRRAQTITWRNLSSYPVVIRLANEEISLGPQETHTRPTDPAFQRLPLKIAARTAAGWEIVASSSQPIRPGLRTLVILRDGRPRPDGIKTLIDFLAFNDLPPPPTGAAVVSR